MTQLAPKVITIEKGGRMSRGFLIFKIKVGGVLTIFLLFLIGAGISGCTAMATQSAPKPVVCTPQAFSNTINIYRATPTPMVISTSQAMAGGEITNLTPEQVLALLGQSQQSQQTSPLQAGSVSGYFGKLIDETKSWSDVETVTLGNSSQAQIIVTFLSPQLIQTVYDNEMYANGSANSNARPMLDKIARRDELIFFMTVLTTTNNSIGQESHKIRIPIDKMDIINADDVNVPPLHDDHNLAQQINSTFEPVFGYITYPFAMQHGTECSWVLNPDYNKKIVIVVPDVFVDDVSAGSFTWVIPYAPLINSEFPAPAPTAAYFDPSQMSNSMTPPGPVTSLLIPGGTPESIFWQNYARFLWKQVVLGND